LAETTKGKESGVQEFRSSGVQEFRSQELMNRGKRQFGAKKPEKTDAFR
jgi:hypothetical protein